MIQFRCKTHLAVGDTADITGNVQRIQVQKQRQGLRSRETLCNCAPGNRLETSWEFQWIESNWTEIINANNVFVSTVRQRKTAGNGTYDASFPMRLDDKTSSGKRSIRRVQPITLLLPKVNVSV